jgi:hypothetical protein
VIDARHVYYGTATLHHVTISKPPPRFSRISHPLQRSARRSPAGDPTETKRPLFSGKSAMFAADVVLAPRNVTGQPFNRNQPIGRPLLQRYRQSQSDLSFGPLIVPCHPTCRCWQDIAWPWIDGHKPISGADEARRPKRRPGSNFPPELDRETGGPVSYEAGPNFFVSSLRHSVKRHCGAAPICRPWMTFSARNPFAKNEERSGSPGKSGTAAHKSR